MHALTIVIGGRKFTKFCLLNSRIILLDNAVDLSSISQSAPEIFAVKVESCPTSCQILDVICFSKF